MLKTLKKLCLWKDCLWMHSLFFLAVWWLLMSMSLKWWPEKKHYTQFKVGWRMYDERCFWTWTLYIQKLNNSNQTKLIPNTEGKKVFFCLKNYHVKISKGNLKFIELVIHKVFSSSFFSWLAMINNIEFTPGNKSE